MIKERKAPFKLGSTEKSLISRKAAKAQRKISWFRQGKVAETTPFSLSSLSSLLIATFFQGSQTLIINH